VGHRYALDTLVLQHTEALERALWTCVRMLHEKVALNRQTAHRLREKGDVSTATYLEEKARLDEDSMAIIRQLITSAAASAPAELARTEQDLTRRAGELKEG
jgi:hypothetical protein